jgi:hypothetical protein
MTSQTAKSREIVARRVAGESYSEIAAAMNIRIATARIACARALRRGDVTAEQIRFNLKLSAKRASQADYDAGWLKRFESRKVPGKNGCIELRAPHNHDGYALLHHRDHKQFAHRIIVILTREPIPPGYMACHRCGNPGCVNPDHIYVGTMQENARDTVAMGRHLEKQKTHCKQGHEFTPENTRMVGPRKTKRQCIACQRIAHQKPSFLAWQKEYKQRRRAERRGRSVA